MRTVRRMPALGALAALALAGVPPAGAQPPTVTAVIAGAEGVFAHLDFDFFDSTVGPAPSVALPPEGGSASEGPVTVSTGVNFQQGRVAMAAQAVTTSAEGALGPDGFATAETTVADIEFDAAAVIDGPTDVYLAADAITATCEADLDGVRGSTTLVDAEVLGEDISGEPEPNTETEVDVPGLATIGVTLNEQVENPDGSLSVTALVLDLDVVEPFGFTGTLRIGPATCGVVESLPPLDPAADVVPTEPVPTEPVPAAVPAAPVPAEVTFAG